MSDLREQERLDAMRRKLYARSGAANSVERTGLTDRPIDVSRNWDIPKHLQKKTEDLRRGVPVQDLTTKDDIKNGDSSDASQSAASPQTPRRRYRAIILIVSLLVFVFGVGLSSLYLYYGGNQVSSNQITVAVDGPFTIGGGEVLDLQIGLVNENDVAIESATLIMKYPPGTRPVGDTSRTIFEERIPIRDIAPGEARQIPLSVVVFGEEQSEQVIETTLEYRISESNSIFYKEADPLAFSISSSPLVLQVDSVEKVSSGQTVDVVMTVRSNASSPLQDIVVSAQYPPSFRYETSSPRPDSGNNVWKIDQLQPEESREITLTGAVVGLSEEEFRLRISAGPAQPDNQFAIGSLLAQGGVDFTIEQPFIDVTAMIDRQETTPVVLQQGEASTVSVAVKNTLPNTVYDMYVEVIPGGNVLSNDSISANSGFFDSNTGTVRWEVANNSSFGEVRPGEERTLRFSVRPASVRRAASYDLVVNVYARRVAEPGAAEQLIGTAVVEARYSSEVFAGGQAGYNTGSFTSRGPIPPEVGEETTYTITLVAGAGVNDLSNAVMNTSLPVYIDWLDQVQGDGELVYNPVSKQLQWDIGDISAETQAETSFQVSLTPSVSQIGDTPVLINGQSFRATDRFTDERLTASSEPVFTELSLEAGYPEDNGEVQR